MKSINSSLMIEFLLFLIVVININCVCDYGQTDNSGTCICDSSSNRIEMNGLCCDQSTEYNSNGICDTECPVGFVADGSRVCQCSLTIIGGICCESSEKYQMGCCLSECDFGFKDNSNICECTQSGNSFIGNACCNTSLNEKNSNGFCDIECPTGFSLREDNFCYCDDTKIIKNGICIDPSKKTQMGCEVSLCNDGFLDATNLCSCTSIGKTFIDSICCDSSINEINSKGICDTSCPTGFTLREDNFCYCDSPKVMVDGICIDSSTTFTQMGCSVSECNYGFTLSTNTCSCSSTLVENICCDITSEININGTCDTSCPTGFSLREDKLCYCEDTKTIVHGICVASGEKNQLGCSITSCSFGFLENSNICECPEASHKLISDICCNLNDEVNSNGICDTQCSSGFFLREDNFCYCENSKTIVDNYCISSGSKLLQNGCIVSDCSDSYIKDGDYCKCDSGTSLIKDICCGSNEYNNNNMCDTSCPIGYQIREDNYCYCEDNKTLIKGVCLAANEKEQMGCAVSECLFGFLDEITYCSCGKTFIGDSCCGNNEVSINFSCDTTCPTGYSLREDNFCYCNESKTLLNGLCIDIGFKTQLGCQVSDCSNGFTENSNKCYCDDSINSLIVDQCCSSSLNEVNANGYCDISCPTGFTLRDDNFCYCDNTKVILNGICVVSGEKNQMGCSISECKYGFLDNSDVCECPSGNSLMKDSCCISTEVNINGICDTECPTGFELSEDSVCLCPSYKKSNSDTQYICIELGNKVKMGCIVNDCSFGFLSNGEICECPDTTNVLIGNICCSPDEVNANGLCDTECAFGFSLRSDNYCYCDSSHEIKNGLCVGTSDKVQLGCSVSECDFGFLDNTDICECTTGRTLVHNLCCNSDEVNNNGICDSSCGIGFTQRNDNYCYCDTSKSIINNLCMDVSDKIENGCLVNQCSFGFLLENTNECNCSSGNKFIYDICCDGSMNEINSNGICDTDCPTGFTLREDGYCYCDNTKTIIDGICINPISKAQLGCEVIECQFGFIEDTSICQCSDLTQVLIGNACCKAGREVNSNGYCDSECSSGFSLREDNYCYCESPKIIFNGYCLGASDFNQLGCLVTECNHGFEQNDSNNSCECLGDRGIIKDSCCSSSEVNINSTCDTNCPTGYSLREDNLCYCDYLKNVINGICVEIGKKTQLGCQVDDCSFGFAYSSYDCICSNTLIGDSCCNSSLNEVNSNGFCDIECPTGFSLREDNFCYCVDGKSIVEGICVDPSKKTQMGCEVSLCNDGFLDATNLCSCTSIGKTFINSICCDNSINEINSNGICDTSCPSGFTLREDNFCYCGSTKVIVDGICIDSSSTYTQMGCSVSECNYGFILSTNTCSCVSGRKFLYDSCCEELNEVNFKGKCDDSCSTGYSLREDNFCYCDDNKIEVDNKYCIAAGTVVELGEEVSLCSFGFLLEDRICNCHNKLIDSSCCDSTMNELNSNGICDTNCPTGFTLREDDYCYCDDTKTIIDGICINPTNLAQLGCEVSECQFGFIKDNSICQCSNVGRKIIGDICCNSSIEVNSKGICDTECLTGYTLREDNYCYCETSIIIQNGICLDPTKKNQLGCIVDECSFTFLDNSNNCECPSPKSLIKDSCCETNEFNINGSCDTSCPTGFINRDDNLCYCEFYKSIVEGICISITDKVQMGCAYDECVYGFLDKGDHCDCPSTDSRVIIGNSCCDSSLNEVNANGICDIGCPTGFTLRADNYCYCDDSKSIFEGICIDPSNKSQMGCEVTNCSSGFLQENANFCSCDDLNRIFIHSICCDASIDELNSNGFCDTSCSTGFTLREDNYCYCDTSKEIIDGICIEPTKKAQLGCEVDECSDGFLDTLNYCSCTLSRTLIKNSCCESSEVNFLDICDTKCPEGYLVREDNLCYCPDNMVEINGLCTYFGEKNQLGCSTSFCNFGFLDKSDSCECPEDSRRLISNLCCSKNGEVNNQGICDTDCSVGFSTRDDDFCYCGDSKVTINNACVNSSSFVQMGCETGDCSFGFIINALATGECSCDNDRIFIFDICCGEYEVYSNGICDSTCPSGFSLREDDFCYCESSKSKFKGLCIESGDKVEMGCIVDDCSFGFLNNAEVCECPDTTNALVGNICCSPDEVNANGLCDTECAFGFSLRSDNYCYCDSSLEIKNGICVGTSDKVQLGCSVSECDFGFLDNTDICECEISKNRQLMKDICCGTDEFNNNNLCEKSCNYGTSNEDRVCILSNSSYRILDGVACLLTEKQELGCCVDSCGLGFLNINDICKCRSEDNRQIMGGICCDSDVEYNVFGICDTECNGESFSNIDRVCVYDSDTQYLNNNIVCNNGVYNELGCCVTDCSIGFSQINNECLCREAEDNRQLMAGVCCDKDNEFNRFGICDTQCGDNFSINDDRVCYCNSGSFQNLYGSCCPTTEIISEGCCQACDPGYTPNYTYNSCANCSSVNLVDMNGKCQKECDSGYAYDTELNCVECVYQNGTCTFKCYPNYLADSNKICRPCEYLDKLTYNGECIDKAVGCPEGTTLLNGVCYKFIRYNIIKNR